LKTFVYLITCLLLSQNAFTQAIPELFSPDKNIRVKIRLSGKLTYQVFYKDQLIVSPSAIDMQFTDGQKLSSAKKISKVSSRNHSGSITSPVPEKRKTIPDVFNELRIDLPSPFYVIFRVYDDGMAYRIGSTAPDSVRVAAEVAQFNFPRTQPFLHSKVQGGRTDMFHTSFEEQYELSVIDSIKSHHLIFNPAVLIPEGGPRIAITESDVDDYPGMFLSWAQTNSLEARFAQYPRVEKTVEGEFPQRIVTERENFIAYTNGTRVYPWRVLIIAGEDRQLPENDIVYRLASPSRINDVSWIRPMQSTDEWIISSNLYNVDFKSGINTETYKYYIDFAKKFGIESVMMDAGWSDNNDLFRITPGIDIEEIMRYAKSNGVKINMWTLAMTLERQLEPALERFNRWGVSFIMTDFFDRDDQVANNRIKRIAEACAKHKIMVMFHGAPKPSGFNRTYPHAVTREGVLGSEFNIWSDKVTPTHNVTLPFTRMLAGPMDYEPGLLNNGTQKTFRPIEGMVMSQGTRTNQLAMYIVYDSPIQFFSGNPSQGYEHPEFMELLGSIPTVWDTTIVLDAKIAQYIVTARKKDGDWFIGAMNDAVARTLSIRLDFLDPGEYTATICEDGLNADRYASDYRLYERTVTARDLLNIKMYWGGGYVIRLKKK